MDSKRALLVYASRHGQTAKITNRLAGYLGDEGVQAQVFEVDEADGVDPGGYDGVVVAGSIHQGKHQKELASWVESNLEALRAIPCAFVSVSLTAAEEDEETRNEMYRLIEEFLTETDWQPRWKQPVAGALLYKEYDFFTRKLMKLIMKRGDHPTDTTQDYEYTDWVALEAFAAEFAEGLR